MFGRRQCQDNIKALGGAGGGGGEGGPGGVCSHNTSNVGGSINT